MHSKFVYFYKKIFDKSFKEFKYKELSFVSLETEQIVNLYKRSKVILDINHINQDGLTMRTFEAIGAGKKLITTNQNIIKYPFYCSNNFYIVDRNKVNIQKSFFETEYIEMPIDLYEKCSIDGWLKDIMLLNEENCWIEMLK